MRTTIKTAAVAAAAACALVLTGCGSSSGGSDTDSAAGTLADVATAGSQPGTLLDTPFAKPNLQLTDNHGKPFNLVKQTAGHPTLLFFGYTHCPDVCPTTMSDLALAKAKLPKADQDKLRVVFVSSDPQRDTPARLTAWLGAMDKSFIGLTGDFTAIQAAARSVGVGISPPVKEKDGSITVTHGAEVLAFWPKDDKGHVLYMSGTTAEQFAHDLPKIIRSEAP
ncbi:SCO family protein [Actinacidiphila bryophytorum]|uniref:Cytochrome oxidase biogenesis protein Sco1/SenC/PrrC, copper metallochaperone n=1 Tax=Actinacidiphila bryophytorum TaxID=1436133 RepID=A0A9W4MJE5_9ACTN|nr:SCO family protein [Actinacidiphila bryophytorum]MBM9437206.1 SCO family protein [Actinacidiphila bryophytorum]MBN6544118.1 SCO family protein [Actinacidiphila bryophytorum]CAG7651071.1 putative Cytochrome oxidase biogenesis protein Sco1/SenC/PrrC, copper metallochaperone [Actinacidiphila bryophytorum]